MLDLIKNALKKVPVAVYVKRKIENKFIALRDKYTRYVNRGNIKIIEEIEMFSVGGISEKEANLTILSVNQTFPFLAKLLTKFEGCTLTEMIPVDEFCAKDDPVETEGTEKLRELFCSYGTDKSTTHDFHKVYGHILKDRSKIDRLLEIGVGSNNNKDIVHSMGYDGKPGASLFAFRDFLPNASIFGADFDKRVLFEDERIKTFYVDQTNLETFGPLGENVGTGFDLIIDDGLHVPNTNIAVTIFAVDRLKVGGWLVIEDAHVETLPLWQVVAHVFPKKFQTYLIKTQACMVIAVQKISD